MRPWLALVLGWGAACAPSPEAHAPEHASGAPSTYGVLTKPATEEPGSTARPPPPLDVGLAPFSETLRPQPPKGVACAIYGRGSARFARCGAPSVQVTDTPSSDVATAVVQLSEADFAWGFYPDGTKAWIYLDDGTFTVDAFADPKDARFVLRREVDVIAKHVWFKEGIAVRVKNADQRGVAVAVEDEVAGIADIDARVPCDTILFDGDRAAPPAALGVSPPTTTSTDKVVYAAQPSLSLYRAPAMNRVATLGSDEQPFGIPLTVVRQWRAWVRVAFETESARFDVWASSTDLSDEPGLWVLGTSSCCGGPAVAGTSAPPSVVLETTRVIVGPSPLGSPTSSVTIRKGAEVDVVSRESGFAAIRPRAAVAVTPPEAAFFWMPESMLVH